MTRTPPTAADGFRTCLDRPGDDPGGAGDCACRPRFEGDRLVLDGTDCPGGGDLAAAPDCRATAVDALADRDARAIATRDGGVERRYPDAVVALLVAAGRFVDAVAVHDAPLADRARHDPLGAARDAAARPPPVSRIAAETGLTVAADGLDPVTTAT